jgi:hypothetical protein
MRKGRPKKKVEAAGQDQLLNLRSSQTISLSPEDQLALWKALQETPKLTTAQRDLGKMMQGKR